MAEKVNTYQFSDIVSVAKALLVTGIFKEYISKNDILSLLDVSTFSISLTATNIKELDGWTKSIPNFDNTLENKLYLLFYYRIFLALKLGLKPAAVEFVGIAQFNKPLSTLAHTGECRHVFFIMHPFECRHYDACARVSQSDLVYYGSKSERVLPFCVVVFSAPLPTTVPYNLSNHPFYHVDPVPVPINNVQIQDKVKDKE